MEGTHEMVGRRLREARLAARTVQLKLRYSDFSTITRARTLGAHTQVDTEILAVVRQLFTNNWKPGATIRLLGVQTSSFSSPASAGQLDLLTGDRHERWQQALSAADRVRDKFGEGAVSLGSAMRGTFRERIHENPAALPGKEPDKKPDKA